MILTITKKVILVLDVVAPLLLVATSLAASGAIAEILMFYDFYRPDPVFPGEYFIFFVRFTTNLLKVKPFYTHLQTKYTLALGRNVLRLVLANP